MKVGIYTNLHKDKDLSVTRQVISAIESAGERCLLCREAADRISGYPVYSEENRPDFMLSLGGDGTILRVAKYCAESGVPILGVNLGHTGFLAEVEPKEISGLVGTLKRGEFTIEERALISAEAEGKRFLALNDIVLSRDAGSRMLETEVYVGGEFVDKYRCDGFIVSTPTGSTAYSLSAGGPILSPNVAALILTSVNSHSLHSRPIVVSDEAEVRLITGETGTFGLIADGTPVLALGGRSEVRVVKSDKRAAFVRLSGYGFYKRLLFKLNKWSTTD